VLPPEVSSGDPDDPPRPLVGVAVAPGPASGVGFGVDLGLGAGVGSGCGVGLGVGLAVGFGVASGVGAGGAVTVTDPPGIESANLSRSRDANETECLPTRSFNE
jgi:hypothetical protein